MCKKSLKRRVLVTWIAAENLCCIKTTLDPFPIIALVFAMSQNTFFWIIPIEISHPSLWSGFEMTTVRVIARLPKATAAISIESSGLLHFVRNDTLRSVTPDHDPGSSLINTIPFWIPVSAPCLPAGRIKSQPMSWLPYRRYVNVHGILTTLFIWCLDRF